MNATLFATLAVRAGDLGVYGTFGSRADAAVAADWQTGEDTYAQPIALHPPETDRLEVTPTTPDPAKGTRSLADLRVAEGLGREAAVLIADGAIGAVPMRMPPGAWALLVTAADRSAASGEVVLFAGEWCEHAYP